MSASVTTRSSILHSGARTRLIGRGREIEQCVKLVLEDRIPLVTVTGVGGVGKTRLAIAVAQRMLEHFTGGAWFVDLAPVGDADLVVPTIAVTLGVPATGDLAVFDALVVRLEHERALLVLDNLEHVIESAPSLARLLSCCPALTILATSRVPLRVACEQTYSIAPLELPDVARVSHPGQVGRAAAVKLFLQRARSVKPDLALTGENAGIVADICCQLDGLPLAIELAAARVRSLPLATLRDRLERRLALLTGGYRDAPPRQQTLRKTIDWSYELLAPDVRRLFRRLAVFRSGGTLEAVAAMAADELAVDVLDGLEALIAHNLLFVREADDVVPRYAMLETIREYGIEQLEVCGELDDVRRRHALLFVEFAETHDARLYQYPIDLTLLDRMAHERDNIRVALDWAIARRHAEIAMRLAGAMRRFWNTRGHRGEGYQYLEAALALDDGVPTAVRARVLDAIGIMADHAGDFPRCRAAYEEVERLYRELGNDERRARILCDLGALAARQGRYVAAREYYLRAYELQQRLGLNCEHSVHGLGSVALQLGDLDRADELLRAALDAARTRQFVWPIGFALLALGELAMVRGDHELARSHFEDFAAIAQESGHKQLAVWGAMHLGRLMLIGDDSRAAAEYFREGLLTNQRLGEFVEAVEGLEGAAACLALAGQAERACQLFAVAARQREAAGVPMPPSQRAVYDPFVRRARAGQRRRNGAAEWSASEHTGLREAVAAAVALLETLATSDAGAAGKARRDVPLTSRERDVLRLLARGHSNKAIGEELYLSARTVERHVANIYTKLDLHNRAEATRFAVQRRLV